MFLNLNIILVDQNISVNNLEDSTLNKSNLNVNQPQNVNTQSLSTRAYLEQTIVPIVTQGMSELARERPENPLEFLANYLLKHAK